MTDSSLGADTTTDSDDQSPVAPSPEALEAALESLPNVRVVTQGERIFYLLGTAHVSRASVDEVRNAVELLRPDVVAVELCEQRYTALTDENQWKNLDIFKVIREGKTLFLLANLAVSAYQRRLGAELGVKPGEEMLAATEAATTIGAERALIDRNIHVTLKRTWGNIGFFRKAALISAIVESLVTKEEDVDGEAIEALKEEEQLSDMMADFSEALPEVKGPLIDERDLYMVSKLQDTEGQRVLAVVGAAHVPGMREHMDDTIDRAAISEIPPRKWWTQLIKWIIPAIVIAAFFFGISENRGRSAQELLYAWVLPNAVMAGLLTLVAGGKIGSVITAFVGSPITSLNPLFNTGFLVGFTEAYLRKPTVDDCERINEDVQSFKGFWKNSFTRVLVVAFASIIGSALGAWIGATWVIALVSTAA